VSRRSRSAFSVARAISEKLSGNDEHPSFMRGLALGALVGAAIAGSTLWNRWHHRRDPVSEGPDPVRERAED